MKIEIITNISSVLRMIPQEITKEKLVKYNQIPVRIKITTIITGKMEWTSVTDLF